MEERPIALKITSPYPPPPKECPITELKRTHTAPELRTRAIEVGLPSTGTKSDLAARLARRENLLDLNDIDANFTHAQLRQRLPNYAKGSSKKDLVSAFLHKIDS